MDRRYRIGDIYYSCKEFEIWNAHDGVMDIDCLLLFKDGADIDELSYIARAAGEAMDNGRLAVMSLREIGGRNAVVLSKGGGAYPESARQVFGYELIDEISGTAGDVPYALGNGSLLDGRYKVLCCIGAGGFGIIYLCEDILLKRNIAIKEYFPEQWAERDETYVSVRKSEMLNAYRHGLESFVKEIRVSSRFIHDPNLITVYDAFMENDTAYMVMEYLNGASIGRELKKRNYKPYGTDEVKEIILPVVNGLIAMHGKGVLHCDISPGNIIRSYTGYICLIDFGAAKYIGEESGGLGSVFLKENYAAPEQFRTAVRKEPSGEGAYTDIYAIGATMYFLLTGKKPEGAVQRLSEGKGELPVPFRCRLGGKKKWLDLVGRCMEMDAGSRVASAESLYHEIKKMGKM